jgi:hypothetical protein
MRYVDRFADPDHAGGWAFCAAAGGADIASRPRTRIRGGSG